MLALITHFNPPFLNGFTRFKRFQHDDKSAREGRIARMAASLFRPDGRQGPNPDFELERYARMGVYFKRKYC